MKCHTWCIIALTACLLSANAASTLAQAVVPDMAEPDPADSERTIQAAPDRSYAPLEDLGPGVEDSGGGSSQLRRSQSGPSYSYSPEPGGYDILEDNVAALGGDMGVAASGLTSRPMQLVVGAEYLYAQATFSDALAFVEQEAGVGDTFHQLDFDYESSFSVYGGFYLSDCGGAVIFDFTRLESSADFEVDSAANIFVPFEVVGPNGGLIRGGADVQLDSYDLSFAKTIPLGCLDTGSQCGDLCCDGCPAWDIVWSGGIRYANVNWNNGAAGFNGTTGQLDNAFNTTLDFDGIGGRVGLLGRRYLGRRGLFSLYAKGDWSILFGDCDIETLSFDVNAVGPAAFARKSNDLTVPVTEIELGGTAHLGAHACLSVGWFWSAWHDLGFSPSYDFEQAGANVFQTAFYDDANILGWNGFFARAEIAF